MSNYNVAIDIDGEYVTGAIIDSNDKVIYEKNIKTNESRTAKDIEKDMESLVESLLKESNISTKDINTIGIAAPGIVNSKTKTVEYACNFNFYGENITLGLQKKYDKPTYIENDANAAVLGEYVNMNGKDIKDMVLLTLRTGVGSGIIIDGKLYQGFNFAGGEIGHMIIEKNARQCNCGNKGCFEEYASVPGFIKTAEEVIKQNNENLTMFDINSNDDKLIVKNIFEAAKGKDQLALKIINIFLDDLAVGTANVVNIFQPQLLLICSDYINEKEMLEQPLRERVNNLDYAKMLKNRCEIEISKLGNNAVLIGAANLYKFQ